MQVIIKTFILVITLHVSTNSLILNADAANKVCCRDCAGSCEMDGDCDCGSCAGCPVSIVTQNDQKALRLMCGNSSAGSCAKVNKVNRSIKARKIN